MLSVCGVGSSGSSADCGERSKGCYRKAASLLRCDRSRCQMMTGRGRQSRVHALGRSRSEMSRII